MKKIIAFLLGLTCIFAISAQNKGYYEQNARKVEKLLVFSSTVENGNEDGSDAYVGDLIRKAIITDYQIYSNYNVIDFYDNATYKEFIEQNKNKQYDIKDPFEVAKIYDAKYALTIKTIIDQSTPSPSYTIDVTIYVPSNNSSLNGYTSAIVWNRNEYLEYAHKEAMLSLLPITDITLTPLGERLLIGSTESEGTLEQAKQDADDINLQLTRTTKKPNSEVAQKIVKIQLDQANEKVRELTKRQSQDEDERIAEQKRTDETKLWITTTSEKADKNIDAIKAEKKRDLSIENQINIIESRKQLLRDNRIFVDEKIKLFNEKQENLKLQEQEERRNRPPEAGEVDAFGTLNESARLIQQKDIINIGKKYEEIKAKYKEETDYYYQNAQDKIAKQINDDVRALESETYISNSIVDPNNIFHVDFYDGDKRAWNYTMSFSFDGNTVYSAENLLNYKTLTGSKAPSTSELIVAKTKDKYNQTVDKYNSLFRSRKPHFNAKVYYKVKSEDYTKPSIYKVSIEKIEIENLTTGKILDTIKPEKKLTYEYFPVTKVDWRTSTKVAQEIKKVENKKEEQKNIMERIERQSRRLTWGSVFILPSVYNWYKTDDQDIQMLGYTLSIGITNHIYAGAIGELGNIKTFPSLDGDFFSNIKDYDFTYTIAGQLGATYKLYDWMRLNAFVEYGKINKENGFGIGASTDLFIKKLGILCGYTLNHNDVDKWMNKFTVGFEFVF